MATTITSSSGAPAVASMPTLPTTLSIWDAMKKSVFFVYQKMEEVGEGVAWFIGLDESKFQYIIDEMTEEEMAVARAIDRKRRIERGEPVPDIVSLTDINVHLPGDPFAPDDSNATTEPAVPKSSNEELV